MSTPDDRKLLGLLDSLSPDHVQRLKTAADDPFALDLSMSPEVADYVLRAVTGLLEDGSRPKSYTGYSPDDVDGRDYDAALLRRAADIVGRENIQNRELRRRLAELDGDDGGTT